MIDKKNFIASSRIWQFIYWEHLFGFLICMKLIFRISILIPSCLLQETGWSVAGCDVIKVYRIVKFMIMLQVHYEEVSQLRQGMVGPVHLAQCRNFQICFNKNNGMLFKLVCSKIIHANLSSIYPVLLKKNQDQTKPPYRGVQLTQIRLSVKTKIL